MTAGKRCTVPPRLAIFRPARVLKRLFDMSDLFTIFVSAAVRYIGWPFLLPFSLPSICFPITITTGWSRQGSSISSCTHYRPVNQTSVSRLASLCVFRFCFSIACLAQQCSPTRRPDVVIPEAVTPEVEEVPVPEVASTSEEVVVTAETPTLLEKTIHIDPTARSERLPSKRAK